MHPLQVFDTVGMLLNLNIVKLYQLPAAEFDS